MITNLEELLGLRIKVKNTVMTFSNYLTVLAGNYQSLYAYRKGDAIYLVNFKVGKLEA